MMFYPYSFMIMNATRQRNSMSKAGGILSYTEPNVAAVLETLCSPILPAIQSMRADGEKADKSLSRDQWKQTSSESPKLRGAVQL
jgi:hypothetical protein